MGVGWISQLIRKVWQLQFRIWNHRNKFLYVVNKGLHIDKRQAINSTIRTEFILGPNGLGNNIASFFQGNVDRILNVTTSTKLQWLTSVWNARDKWRRINNMSKWYKDPVAASFFLRNKTRKKWKKEEDFTAL